MCVARWSSCRGEAVGAIDAERAIILALECLGREPEHDARRLVEDAPAQKIIEQRVRTSQRVASISGRVTPSAVIRRPKAEGPHG